VELGCGQAGEDAVSADLLDIGHHGGEIGELRLLQLNDVECRSTVLPYPSVERMATSSSTSASSAKRFQIKVPLRTVTAYQNQSRYIETGI
jgi:hypothetical protein